MEGDSPPNTESDLVPPNQDISVIMKYPTLFGTVRERSVTFCIDTSGSMYRCLDAIKDDLKKTLLKLSLEPDTHFNLIEFSTEGDSVVRGDGTMYTQNGNAGSTMDR